MCVQRFPTKSKLTDIGHPGETALLAVALVDQSAGGIQAPGAEQTHFDD
jgi:hypothetical protein